MADTGVGIFDAMIDKHSKLRDSREALEKALWPRISGTFVEGLSGSRQNAGLGLFFISEMAKLTGGRLLLASRDAALLLTADPEAGDNHDMRFLKPDGLGYPGTLVAFELPVDSVGDYDDLIETIQRRARERTPKRAQHHWIRYEESPSDATAFVVRHASENTERAEELAREQLEPRIYNRGTDRSGLRRNRHRHPELSSRAAVRSPCASHGQDRAPSTSSMRVRPCAAPSNTSKTTGWGVSSGVSAPPATIIPPAPALSEFLVLAAEVAATTCQGSS